MLSFSFFFLIDISRNCNELLRVGSIVETTGFGIAQAADPASRRRLLVLVVVVAGFTVSLLAKGAANRPEQGLQTVNEYSAHGFRSEVGLIGWMNKVVSFANVS